MKKANSFTEYIKIKFDNKLWELAEYYLDNCFDFNSINLRRISKIGDVEIQNVSVEHVWVRQKSDTLILFDIAFSVELVIRDGNYRNDEYDDYKFWLMAEFEGDLQDELNNAKLNSLDTYSNKNRTKNDYDDSLVTYISKDDMDKVATEFLSKYYPEALQKPTYIEPIELINRMGLQYKITKLSNDNSVFGRCVFYDTEFDIYDSMGHANKTKFTAGTVLVDKAVTLMGDLGMQNSTFIHECIHWEYHKNAFALAKLYEKSLSSISSGVFGDAVGIKNKAVNWMEWQANTLTPKIQMPIVAFKTKLHEYHNSYQQETNKLDLFYAMPYCINQLSQFFGVSKLSVVIRLVELGFEEARGSLVYVDGNYVPTHRYKTGRLKSTQTYSVPVIDAALQIITNTELQKLVSRGQYVYVDSHFVLNNKRYVTKIDGKETLTDYARSNMDECALIFNSVIKQKIENHYLLFCYLNRDKNTPFNFEFEFSGEHDLHEKTDIVRDTCDNYKQLFTSFNQNLSDNLNKCLKWSGKTKRQIANEIGMDEKSVGNIFNNHSIPQLKSLILIALSLGVPGFITVELMRQSGYSFRFTDNEHILLNLVVNTMYSKDMSEILSFLRKSGVSNV